MKTRYLISKPLSTKVPMNKIETKITLKDLSQTLQKPVNVLLYEASTDLTGRNLSCNEGCTIITDSQNINNIKELSVKSFENQLQINIDGQQLTTSSVKIIASSGNTVDITNYKRASFAGIPRNSFKGSLTIQRDVIRLLDSTGVTVQSVVTNQLSLEDYMKGVAETNDQEHIEKNKVIAMITKNYLLYYLDKENIHPSIPSRALYNAIDDPRSFQKYVGAGFEKTVKNWQQALDNTQDKIIMYKGFLPILPYFNCSAGFTRSAAEKRGRTDTPWLKSTLDMTRCVDFNGHGVGLSGK